jgi:hypothetical protein
LQIQKIKPEKTNVSPLGIAHPYFVWMKPARLPSFQSDREHPGGQAGDFPLLAACLPPGWDKLLVPCLFKEKTNVSPLGIAHPYFVRMKGLEPPRRKAPDPKSGASTNSATPAFYW